MKETDWIVTLKVQYDQQHIVKLRYGISALTAEIALVRAGVKAKKRMTSIKIVDVSIVKEKPTGRVIRVIKQDENS